MTLQQHSAVVQVLRSTSRVPNTQLRLPYDWWARYATYTVVDVAR